MQNDKMWVGKEPDTSSPYYPFRKVTSENSLAGAENLPYILTKYLMDLPSNGYTPPEDNSYPRARLKKLLYWDCPLPLNKPLPTADQMKNIQFDPERPADPPDSERGYRIYSQELVRQAQDIKQSLIRVYLGNVDSVPMRGGFIFRQSVIFTVMVNYALESNMKTVASSRSYSIAQAICEAVNGVSFGGIGGLKIRNITKFDDERVNTGYKIYAQIDWCSDAPNENYTNL